MTIEITGRNVEVTNSMRDYAGKRLDKLLAEFPRIDKMHMILDVQKFTHLAEVIVHAARHIQLEGKATSENMYASIDEAVDKVEAQLRKTLDKRHEHKGNSKLRDLEPTTEVE
ncbi:MAG: ribosome-associated translation inhibitor RaiA [bacterium]|jgi:putative sigma-54 modulation protein